MLDLAESWVLANPLETAGVLCAIIVVIGVISFYRARDRDEPEWTSEGHPRC
jgi:hypothetical protein